MSMQFLFRTLLLLFLFPLSAFSQTVWVDGQQKGDTIYLLRQSPAQIMRFAVGTESWLPPLPLTEVPRAFVVDSSHIFISYGRKVERIDLGGTNKVHVANSSDDINGLLLDGNLLFANRTSSLVRAPHHF